MTIKSTPILLELDNNDHEEADLHIPDAAEINRRIEELKKRQRKYLILQDRIKANGRKEISSTDPDARMMVANNNGLDVVYNVQISVDDKHGKKLYIARTQENDGSVNSCV